MGADRGRPSESDKRQVVQMAAILWDSEQSQELSSFEVFTKPAYEKVLPVFFTELTGITQETLNQKAIDFKSGLQEFQKFSKNYPIWTFNDDWGVLKQNCEYISIPFPYNDAPFVRVKPLLPTWGIDAEKYSSGTLYQAAKLKIVGHVHNALHDVRSMAAAVDYFEKSRS
jgi:DNA polymerase III alpha subunit (gram-positive type)